MHIIKHFVTITKHRHKVMRYCFRAGLYKQGLCHDLSKYSRVEFINGAKYYAGTFSPNHNERQAKGYSEAWMHHKGRNRHHTEYWVDVDIKDNQYKPVPMPDRYIAESICDRIAASEIYNQKNFHPHMVLDYFMREKDRIPMHDKTKQTMEEILNLYVQYGKKYILHYLRENMRGKNKKKDNAAD